MKAFVDHSVVGRRECWKVISFQREGRGYIFVVHFRFRQKRMSVETFVDHSVDESGCRRHS